MSLYGKSEYWQQRYGRNTEPFDWYQRFYAFKQHLMNALPQRQSSRLLIPGCGNSRLGEQLVQQGYGCVTNIDFSVSCIKNMSTKYKQKTQKIKYECMDIKDLLYQNQSFDGVIDKALLDCIMCDQNANQNGYRMLCEVYRVLKRKGVYISLSYQSPERRQGMLQRSVFNWKVNVIRIDKPFSKDNSYSLLDEQGDSANYHYLYICTKD